MTKKRSKKREKFSVWLTEWKDRRKKMRKRRISNWKRRIKNNFKKSIKYIFSSKGVFLEIFFEFILFLFLLVPMFHISFSSGILFILTFLYIILFHSKTFTRQPGYVITIFSIFVLRACVLPILFEGLEKINSNWISGTTFIIAWIIIYIKTYKLKKIK